MSDYDPEWGGGRRPHVDGASDWDEVDEWVRVKKAEEKRQVRDIRRRQELVRGDRVYLTEPYRNLEARTSGVVVCQSFRKNHVFVSFEIGKHKRCVSVPKEMLFKITFPANVRECVSKRR